MTTPALDVTGVAVRFGGINALGIDRLTVPDGAIVGIIGANGAGKTTLFDVISGFVRPHSGRIELAGRNVTTWRTSRRARAGLGRSFQNAILFESLTVAETVAVAFERHHTGQDFVSGFLAMPWSRRAERRIRTRVDALIQTMGLDAYHDKFIGELSTGTRRMVDLACVMAHGPSVLLLDEPSSGIAQREVEALETVLLRVRADLGCTLCIVEHDIPLIRSLSDEMYALETGRVIAHGAPAAVLADPAVVSSYLGTDRTAVERSGVHPAGQ